MEQHELNRLMKEMAATLRGLGIPVADRVIPEVRVNSRAKRRLGCCIYREGRYTIEVSSVLLDRPEQVRQTLAHELLHTCWGCRNHGERWKAYAARVNEALGFSIQRTVEAEGDQERLRQDEVKYILECQSCGARISRRRMSKAVKSPWRYRCKCGGKLKRIQ